MLNADTRPLYLDAVWMRGTQKIRWMDREHDGGLKLMTRLINGASPGVKLWPALDNMA